MRTIEELLRIERNELEPEEEKLVVDYWFNKYEAEGFAKVFCSPFDFAVDYNGKKFEVIGRVKSLDEDEENGVDLDSLPMWNIRFEDGRETVAYPEEIIPSEIRDNLWRESDKQFLKML